MVCLFLCKKNPNNDPLQFMVDGAFHRGPHHFIVNQWSTLMSAGSAGYARHSLERHHATGFLNLGHFQISLADADFISSFRQ